MILLDGLPILDHLNEFKSHPNEAVAWAIIQDFFNSYDKDVSKETLRDIVTIALISDRDDLESVHRSNIIFFYDYSCALYQAIDFLLENHLTKKRNKRKT